MSQSYAQSFIKDNTIVHVGQILAYIHGIIIIPLIIKTVGVTIYGGFVLLSTTLGLVFGISSLGIGFKARRFLPSSQSMIVRRNLFYPQFFFQMFSITLLAFLLVLLDKQIKVSLLKSEISYSAVIIPIYLISYFLYSQGSDYFRYTSRINYMTLTTVCFTYIYIGIILLFYYLFKLITINILIISQILSGLCIAIPCFYTIIREIGLKIIFFKKNEFMSDIKIGFPIVLNFIIDFILSSSDRYVISLYLSVSDVGYYNSGYALGSLIIFIPKAMGTAVPQLLSRAIDKSDEKEAQKMLNYSIKIFLLMAIPFTFGSMVLSKTILTILSNRAVAENAYFVTPIVALGTVFYGLFFILSYVLFVRIKTYTILKMNIFASAFNLLTNLVVLYFLRFIIVAAVTTLISYFLIFIFIYKIVNKDWPVNLDLITMIKSLAASSIMAAILFWISFTFKNANMIYIVVGDLILGIIVYFVTLFFLKTFSKEELNFIKTFLRRSLMGKYA
jgi:O-antigen/teichoic acid export membrane protein